MTTFWSRFSPGWWYGFGVFTVGLYWISYALHVDWARFFWITPFALFGLPAILACWLGAVSFIACRFGRTPFQIWTLFSLLWVVAEWSRGVHFTGFPWNPLGLMWSFQDATLQGASVIGVYGLSALSVWAFSGLALVLWKKYWVAALPVALTVGLYLFGAARLNNAQPDLGEGLQIRLVQPNILQVNKWNPDRFYDNFQTLVDLTILPSTKKDFSPKVIVWPESAIPYFLEKDVSAREAIAESIPEQSILLTGGLRKLSSCDLRNSILAIDSEAQIIGAYDKVHLVPFGEYLPFRSYWPEGITKVTSGECDFTPGSGRTPLHLPGLPLIGGLVCYEGIFSGAVMPEVGPRPEWFLNVTNDGWYGDTWGPQQHLQLVRLRAVEEGIPLVRVANTGISAVFDGYGREIATLDYGGRGILDVILPAPLQKRTFYSHFGGWFLVLWVLSLGFLFSLARFRKKEDL
ncbi:MAG: apolipoprotein N-acyltransferase [bacterium]|nr:apolipoprotein N-acyltransferase [bacterium]